MKSPKTRAERLAEKRNAAIAQRRNESESKTEAVPSPVRHHDREHDSLVCTALDVLTTEHLKDQDVFRVAGEYLVERFREHTKAVPPSETTSRPETESARPDDPTD